MLMRNFTKREKILLLLLSAFLIISLYFAMVHYPVENRLAEIELERSEIEDKIEDAKTVCEEYDAMKSELDEIFALPEDEITVMPDYDNLQMLVLLFEDVFGDVSPDLRFNVNTDGDIVSRSVNFSFTAPDYSTVRDILSGLTKTGYRSQLKSVTVSPSYGGITDGELSVAGCITFYEVKAE